MPLRSDSDKTKRSIHPCVWGRLLLAAVLFPLFCQSPAALSATLSAEELKRRLGDDEIGTTLAFEGSKDRLFYAGSWTNTLRRSKSLGRSFIRDKIRKDTIAEGAFLGTFGDDRAVQRSGIAGIVADQQTGNGIVILIETFAADRSLQAFQKGKRGYMLLLISEDGSDLTCKRSNWNVLGGKADQLRFTTSKCRFVIGNNVVN